jgi:bifunctional DNA-binding transcriptional regulator/antitoxin component of YhaV-PrlF toxin-antitoxin module
MIIFMIMKARMKISKGGQISVPAAVRHRWGTSTVTVEDQGDQLVIAPAPDDPIAAAEGALAGELPKFDAALLRRTAREDERAAERRRTAS